MGLVSTTVLLLGMGAGSLGWSDHIAAHYAPGLFERVAARRNLPAVSCYIASPEHAIGAWLLVEGARTNVRRRCLVADTSEPWDRPRHLAQRLVELDADSALVICGSLALANRDCPVRVSDFYLVNGSASWRVPTSSIHRGM